MPGTYSKPCQMSKMMRHIENHDIIRTVVLGIFRHIQGHPAIFSPVQAYLGVLGHIEVYSGITEG